MMVDERGGILIMTLVFVSMFVVIFGALTGLVTRSYHQATLQIQDELAFQVAEAGVNYGRWRLAHNSEDFAAETREVADQFAGVLGSYTVTFTAPQEGSTVIIIESTGITASQPSREVTVRARYGIPSLARYASVTNGDVWYGGEIVGVVHANGGIRMDGESDSLMTSTKETYTCQPHHGCDPASTQPGIWGTGEREELWEFPVTAIDYNALTLDLLDIKTTAQDSGTYYGPSGSLGYQLVFNSNNTYSIYQVLQKTAPVWSWSSETDWEYSSYDVLNTQLVEVHAVPSLGVIFVEDTLWLKGEVRDRVTVAAGRFPDTPATNADIIINGDITYGDMHDGTRVLGVIAQRHVLIPYSGAEDVLEMDGAFIAQKGRFGRRYYQNCCGTQTHVVKTKLERYGMIASNLVPVTAWVDESGTVISGYQQAESTYDPYLLYGPPPYFPTTGEYEFISWEEVE